MSEPKVAVQVDGRTLTLTNLGKVLYPDTGFTKAEVLDYYQRVAPVLLPHIAGRPLTLKRYPEGVNGQAFFHKHVTAHRPDWIRTARVDSESSRARGASVTYLVVDDLPALIWRRTAWRRWPRPPAARACSSTRGSPGSPPPAPATRPGPTPNGSPATSPGAPSPA